MKPGLLLLALLAPLAFAQAAKKTPPNEIEIPFPADLPIPPATVLSPEETLATIQVPPGFHVELVACEPMITTPVAMQFDPAGRLWVVEMNGYMPNVDGAGEEAANGRIVVLEDTDGNGRMDRSTVFLEGLVMPRAILLRKGGAVIAEPPMLYWCPDEDHDLKADRKEPLLPNYATAGNPEHMPNGLLLALDNWIYSAKSNRRYRFAEDGTLKSESTLFRGQWGICQDDFGRLYYNLNSDQLRADLLPSAALTRNPNFKSAEGVNVQIAKSQKTFPGRVTPGVNRGYRAGQLREGKLTEFTAACGPLVYRGDLFPAEFRGNSFVCEPSANLVKRNLHTERDGDIMAKDAYPQREFLTSTSERFRPVNTCTGPDGALYLADMARGVVQHITYVSPWLRRQILERKLELPLTQGRIWRVLPDGAKRSPAPPLATAAQQVAALSHANGWTRDTAQRLLVEGRDPATIPALEALARTDTAPLGRLHALWTLEGLEKLTPLVVVTALGDPDAKLRATGIRLGERFLATEPALFEKIAALTADQSADVQLQLLCSLGEMKNGTVDELIAKVVTERAESHLARSAALSSLRGRELEFLTRLLSLPDWQAQTAGRDNLLAQLARCVVEEHHADRVRALLALAQSATPQADWQRSAILNGASGVIPAPKPPADSLAAEQATIGAKAQGSNGLGRGFRPFKVDDAPPELAALARSGNAQLEPFGAKVSALFVWPGKPGYSEPKPPAPLTPEQEIFVQAGKQLYAAICVACHQPTGLGQEGLAPPVANSEWATGPEARLIRIVLQGIGGPMSVNGKDYSLDMPGLGAALNDEQIAQVLSYLRRDFGNLAPVVTAEAVATIRESTLDRGASWTAAELERIH